MTAGPVVEEEDELVVCAATAGCESAAIHREVNLLAEGRLSPKREIGP